MPAYMSSFPKQCLIWFGNKLHTLAALVERIGFTLDHSLQHVRQFLTAEFNINYIVMVRKEWL